MKVQAIQLGYYDNRRRRVGEVFSIKDEVEFSSKWMKKVDEDKPVEKAVATDESRKPVAPSKASRHEKFDSISSVSIDKATGNQDVI